MKRVLTVACYLPGGVGEHVGFNSKASLLDADFVLFYPTLKAYSYLSTVSSRGKSALSKADSQRVWQDIGHWNRELRDVLNAGNTVFMVLSDREEINLSTGKLQHRVTTNYDVFPSPIRVIESQGNSMVLAPNEPLLKDYWQQFGGESQYRVYIHNVHFLRPLVTTRHGDRVVGAMSSYPGGGALVALPWLDLEREEYIAKDYEDEHGQIHHEWTPEAKDWGIRYLKTLESLDKAIRSQDDKTPTPQWTQHYTFKTDKETALSRELLKIETELFDLEQRRQQVELNVANAGSLKALLFEQGRTLEAAVLKATRILGFHANNYRDSESEFDLVLECPEGRCIGEVEGRDRKAIDITKMRQLETNIHEDLDREEVSEPAKAVLFGNAYRFVPPSDRPEHFTQKCIKAAQRTNTALIRTCDLFEVAKALVDKPDPAFTAACRKAILKTSGEEVKFPTLPEPDENNHGNNPS